MSTFISSPATSVIPLPVGIANFEEASAELQERPSSSNSVDFLTVASTENGVRSCEVISSSEVGSPLTLDSSPVVMPLQAKGVYSLSSNMEAAPDPIPLNFLEGSPQATEADFISSSILSTMCELDRSSEGAIAFLGDDCLASADLAEADCPTPPTLPDFETIVAASSNDTPTFHPDNTSSFGNREEFSSLAPCPLKTDIASMSNKALSNPKQLTIHVAKTESELDGTDPTGSSSPTLESSPYHSGISTSTSDGAMQRAIDTLSSHTMLNPAKDQSEKVVSSNDTSNMDSSQNFFKTHQLSLQSDGKSKRSSSICRHWLMGKCNKGDACQYSHRTLPINGSNHNGGIVSHVAPSKKSTVCTYWKQGLCTKGAECRFAHTDDSMDHLAPIGHSRLTHGRNAASPHAVSNTPSGYRMELCRFRHFGCPRGFHCNDAHTIDELRPGKFTQDELRALKITNDVVGTSIEGPGRRREIPTDGGYPKTDRKECFFWPQGQCKKGERCPFLHQHNPDGPSPSFPNGGRFPIPRAFRGLNSPEPRYIRSTSPGSRPRMSRSPDKFRRMRPGLSRSRSRSNTRPTPPWASAACPWRNRKGKLESSSGGGSIENPKVSNHLRSSDVGKGDTAASKEFLVNSSSSREMNSQYHDSREFYRPRKDNFYVDPPMGGASRRDYKGGMNNLDEHLDRAFNRESDVFPPRNRRETLTNRIENRPPAYCGRGDGAADLAFRGMRRYVSGSGTSASKGEPWRF